MKRWLKYTLSEEMEKVKNEKLEENLCELQVSKELNSDLCTKLGESNDKLYEARKELVKVCVSLHIFLE